MTIEGDPSFNPVDSEIQQLTESQLEAQRKRAQVEAIQIEPINEVNASEYWMPFAITVDGEEIGQLYVGETDAGIPSVQSVTIIDPRFRDQGYGSALYMKFCLNRNTDLVRGSNNANSNRVWESLIRKQLVENDTVLKVDRVRKYLGIEDGAQ